MKNTRQGTPSRVGILYTDPEQKERAEVLARNLDLPVTEISTGFDFVLIYSRGRLCLSVADNSSPHSMVYAEFVKGPAGYRRKRGSRERLLRAIGFRGQQTLTVLDATGGLGGDSFLMAGYGCIIHVLERNPIVAALLNDGLRRAAAHPETRGIAARITLSVKDSLQHMYECIDEGKKYDSVYLDPMYPERNKTALAKKEMQMLQRLLGHEGDTERLLNAALETARRRVVVKRPRNTQPLGGSVPSHSLEGKTTRFDVYLV